MKFKKYYFRDEAYYRAEEVDNIIKLESWKGKDKIKITKKNKVYYILEHRKDKDTGEIGYITHEIKEDDVEYLYTMIICPRCKIGESATYRKIVLDIISNYNIPISIDEFNGGRNRRLYYFSLYYYPMKILEHKKYILYGGRGKITRLR